MAFGSNTRRWVTRCKFMGQCLRRSLYLHILEDCKRILFAYRLCEFALSSDTGTRLSCENILLFHLQLHVKRQKPVHCRWSHSPVARNLAFIDTRPRQNGLRIRFRIQTKEQPYSRPLKALLSATSKEVASKFENVLNLMKVVISVTVRYYLFFLQKLMHIGFLYLI